MKHFCYYLSAVAILLSFPRFLNAASPHVVGTYPMPVLETKEMVEVWLQRAGFQVSTDTNESGNVRLSCGNEVQAFHIEIVPRSPLASSVTMESNSGDGEVGAVFTGLRESLDVYALSIGDRTMQARIGLPRALKSYGNSVFCLSALSKGIQVRFSGFAVGRRGFIITTGHDLEGIRRVTVTTSGGKSMDGEIAKRDPDRDLTLIRVKKRLKSVIPIDNERLSLRAGDRVYSFSCSPSDRYLVSVGIIDQTPAVVNGQLLWQVTMEVNPGSSGSPVFLADGRLAGVVKGRYRGTSTRGFLIPLDAVLDFLNQREN